MPGNTDLILISATIAAINDAVTNGPTASNPSGGPVITNQNTVVVKFLGNLAATVQCEVSMDGTSWNNCLAQQMNGVTAPSGALTLAGNEMAFANVAGVPYVRFRISAATSGSAVATMRITDAMARDFTGV